jgi:hypothetical protein
VRVLVVWEPILAMDWRPPSSSTLGRIADSRGRQFWDPTHVVSAELKQRAALSPTQSRPDCCIQKGFYWDEALLFPAGAHWKNDSAPVFWNGPVVKVISGLEPTLTERH